MKKQLLALASISLLLTACEKNGMDKNTNSRDRNDQTMQEQQNANPEDMATTQRIRAALMDDDSLSSNARNIKIIIVSGVATLRGTVNSDKEKNDVEKITKSTKGVRSVDNQLEVSPSTPRSQY